MQLGMNESTKTVLVGRPPSPHPRRLYATKNNNNTSKNKDKSFNTKNTKGMCF